MVTALVDLLLAYDSLAPSQSLKREGLILKVSKIFHYQKTIRPLSVFLGDRKIHVGLNGKTSHV